MIPSVPIFQLSPLTSRSRESNQRYFRPILSLLHDHLYIFTAHVDEDQDRHRVIRDNRLHSNGADSGSQTGEKDQAVGEGGGRRPLVVGEKADRSGGSP